MKLWKIILVSLIFAGCSNEEIQAQEPNDLREEVIVENNVFKVWYNEVYEQPMKLVYTSTNRVKNVDRGSMNFYKVDGYHTSDNADYYRNIYDKGHLAPAATYSDSKENLKLTFSFLNCALQDQYLNRGEWRLLEEQERKWDDEQNLTITVELTFDEGHMVLPTGGHIPTDMIKHIKFDKTGSYRCFEFENVKPTKGWEEHEVTHSH
jgi:DNA/RNA endonuclease G (NUC1)